MQYKRFSIGFKLALVPVLLIASLALVIVFSIASINNQKFDSFVVSIAARQATLVQRYMKEISLASQGITVDYGKTQKILITSVDALIDGGEVTADLVKNQSKILPAVPTEEIRQKLLEQKKFLEEFNDLASVFLKLKPSEDDYLPTLTQLLFLNQKINTSANEAVNMLQEYDESKITHAVTNLVFVGLLIVMVSIIFTVLVIRSIIKSFKAAIDILKNSANNLSIFSEQTVKEANANSTIARDVAIGATQQSAQAEKISITIAEMAKAIRFMSQNASKTAKDTKESTTRAKEAEEAGLFSKQSLKNIEQSFQQTSDMVQKLSDHSQQIGKIIEVITKISEQTNLLALNASIEAARAGEAGKGFAVVAEEVRNLAKECVHSAEAIKELVLSMQAQINASEDSVKVGADILGKGVVTIDQTLDKLQLISTSVGSISREVDSMAAGVEQQAVSTNEISKNMDAIAAVIEQNSSSSKDLSHSIEEQNQQIQQIRLTAQGLQSLAANFQHMLGKLSVSAPNVLPALHD